MKGLLIIFLLATTLLFSCDKSGLDNSTMNGTYSGTFQRLNNSGTGQFSNVTIVFGAGKWTGQSQFDKYPALCGGAVTKNGNTISFSDTCIWTAEFDWTLILSGDFKNTSTKDTLQFERENALYKDIYKLVKQ